jgi:hypothetical protein
MYIQIARPVNFWQDLSAVVPWSPILNRLASTFVLFAFELVLCGMPWLCC